jgi:pyruvate,water dikinase
MSPQVLPIYEKMLNDGERRYMGRLLAPFEELGPIFKIFHGRMYMNLSQMRRVMSLAGAPAADMLRSIGHADDIRPEDERPVRPALRDVLRALRDFVRLAINDARAASVFAEHERFTRGVIERFEEQPAASLSDGEIWNAIQQWIGKGPDTIRAVFVMSGVMFRETKIKKACEKVGYSYERLVYPQLAAGQRSVSSQQAIDLVALADVARAEPRAATYLLENDGTFADRETTLAGTRFLACFHQFLERYGHRGRYESDWALPRLREDPAPVLFAIREQLKSAPQDIAALTERQEADAARAWREFESRLSRWQRWTLLPGVRAMVRRLKQQYVWREQVRSDLTRELGYARLLHLELACRFVERGWIDRRDDYFMIPLEEIAAVIEEPSNGWGLRAIADRHATQFASERDLHLPLLATESELQQVTRRADHAITTDGELTGLCVSPGVVEAEVVVLRDPSEFAAMRAGAILVTRATDPSWTPLFTLASGVIVEVGGMLSHASTIAREYGLPALANVKHATRVLKTGDRITLDASGRRIVRNL